MPAIHAGRVVSYDGTQKNDGHENRTYPGAKPRDIKVASHANLRNVWTIPTSPFKEAHFATFPPALVEKPVRAGTSAHGVCSACGAPWTRQVERRLIETAKAAKTAVVDQRDHDADGQDRGSNFQKDGHMPGLIRADKTLGWAPTCDCDAETAPAVVLDPFAGSGTVGLVADQLGRDAILIEINPTYAAMAKERIGGETPMFTDVELVIA